MSLRDFLLGGAGRDSYVRSFLVYIAYGWGTSGRTAGAIAGHLAAVKFVQQMRGIELFLRHQWIVDALDRLTIALKQGPAPRRVYLGL